MAGRRPPLSATPPTTRDALRRPVHRPAEAARAVALDDGMWLLELPLPYPRPRAVNAYVLPLGDGLCLVDCGSSLAPGWSALVAGLSRAGLSPGDVRVLVCTHLHADHAGLAAEVRSRTGCELLRGRGPEGAQDLLRDFAVPISVRRRHAVRAGAPPAVVDDLVDANVAGEGHHERASADRVLDPGDELVTAAGTWRVVPVPGHQPGQIGLFDPVRRWMISADLAYAGGDPYVEFGLTLDPLTDHLASLERVARLEPAQLLPGHGRPTTSATDAQAVLMAARDATTLVLERTRAAVRDGPRTAYALALQLVDGDPDLDRRQGAVSTAICALEHLVLRGEVTVDLGEDGARRYRWSESRHRGRTAPGPEVGHADARHETTPTAGASMTDPNPQAPSGKPRSTADDASDTRDDVTEPQDRDAQALREPDDGAAPLVRDDAPDA